MPDPEPPPLSTAPNILWIPTDFIAPNTPALQREKSRVLTVTPARICPLRLPRNIPKESLVRPESNRVDHGVRTAR